MKVLGLCSYPIEAAATRFRVEQFVAPLRDAGIELTIRPFLDRRQFRGMYSDKGVFLKSFGMIPSVLKRISDFFSASRYDLIFVQREAMFFGPAVFECLIGNITRVPMILDLDDATYIPYTSPRYGKLASALKFFGKTDRLIEISKCVICGNRFIAEHVETKGKRAVIIPTVVDNEKFQPVESKNIVPVIGWIGTHSTFPSLESIFPVLQRLSRKHQFVLRVVGSGQNDIDLPSVEVEAPAWRLETEIEHFQSFDIGLYPIATSSSANEDWLKGKSGFKAIQYMAVGIPFVMSPVGVCAEMGVPGKTHFDARTPEDWYNSLDLLLTDKIRRHEMGEAALEHSLENYSLISQTEVLARVFHEVADLVNRE